MDWLTISTLDDAPLAWAGIPQLRTHLADQHHQVLARTEPHHDLFGAVQVHPLQALGRRLGAVQGGHQMPGATLRAFQAGSQAWVDANTPKHPEVAPDVSGLPQDEWEFAWLTAEQGPLWGAARLFWTAHTRAEEARAQRAARLTTRTRVRDALATRDAALDPLRRAWWSTGQAWDVTTADAAAFIATYPVLEHSALTPHTTTPTGPVRTPIRLRD